jgi:hypothetical protein
LFTLLSVIRAYNTQKIQHAIELQKQREHYESLALEEKKRHDRFNKKLDYPRLGVI